MEQHIGHRSFYQNLRQHIDQTPQLVARWTAVTYERPGSLLSRGPLAGQMQVRRALRQSPSDVVLFNTQVPAALVGSPVRRRPYVLCTDITPIQYDEMGEHYGHKLNRNPLIRWYKHRANKKLFQSAARVLPWSNWVRESLINDYDVSPQNIEVIPPGVDVNLWRPCPRRQPGGPLRVLFVGGDFYRKGGDDLLAALQLLPEGLAELVLVTRSAVPEQPRVKVYRNMQSNSVELVSLAQSCDVFVLPTKAEAFGIAAVEASAVGLPVVGTAVGGLPDVVDDGVTGFLIQPGDKQALASRLKLLAENAALRQRLGKAARERVLKKFDARQNASRVVEILYEVTMQTGVNRTGA
ncbi:MAG: glycosyltransferase family 4 protein [Anaerolineae bacterium]